MKNQAKIKPTIDTIQAVPKKKDAGGNFRSQELIRIEDVLLGPRAVGLYRKIRESSGVLAAEENSLFAETEKIIEQALRERSGSEKNLDDFLSENHKRLFERSQDCRKRLQMVVNIDSFLRSEESKDLRPEQKEAIISVANMILRGKRKGYIKMPTGIGKTVIFTSLLKAFGKMPDEDESSEGIKSLVVVPKTDLVTQTLGHEEDEEGKKRGLRGWAAELNAGVFYGKGKNLNGDVVVTTYDSFITLAKASASNGQEKIVTEREIRGKKIREKTEFSFNKYDVVIFDEAHGVTGETASEKAEDLPPGIIQIGFTATPDYNYSVAGGGIKRGKRVSDFLEEELYSMELEEAINKGLLSEVSCKTIRTEPITLEGGKDIVRGNGEEYSQDFYDKMMRMESRNNQAIDEAIKLIESGRKGIISCIPGKNEGLQIEDKEFNGAAAHAFYIAQELSKRGKKAVAVFGGTSDERKKEIYEGFEKGDIDCICFVDMIKEGWDSDVARFLINLRPTKSEVLAKQRLGRVLRKNDKLNQNAIVVEFTDEIIEQNNPYSTKTIFNNQGDEFIIGGGPGGGGPGGPRNEKKPGLFGKSPGEVVEEDVFEIKRREPDFDVTALPDFYPLEEIEKYPKNIQAKIIEEMIRRHDLNKITPYIDYAIKNELELTAKFHYPVFKEKNGRKEIVGHRIVLGGKNAFAPARYARVAGAKINTDLTIRIFGRPRDGHTIPIEVLGIKEDLIRNKK